MVKFLADTKTNHLGIKTTFACNYKVAAASVMCIPPLPVVKGNKTIMQAFVYLSQVNSTKGIKCHKK